MTTLEAGGRTYVVARAVEADVPAIVGLLTDDPLGATRESEDLEPYLAAFRRIDADPQHLLVVVRDDEDQEVGTMQLTRLPGLARAGATRLQLEAVRLAPTVRGAGLGAALFAWAHEYGRAHGASIVQLTTDKRREAAQRFYRRRGYEASHEGFKLAL